MIKRLLSPLKSNSFIVLGARGTGKSTLVRERLGLNGLYLDFFDEETFDRFLRVPKALEEVCAQKKPEWVIIDEFQRLPKILNSVHRLIENRNQKFALTGSSARKIKRGAANLLAGRAFLNILNPFTSEELGEAFSLEQALHWGTLPKLLHLTSLAERKAYLRSYCLTYIREEIQMEQVVRKLEPFREFLAVAAQHSGKIINFSSIAKDIGVQIPTVQTYFQILEDTYLGFFLPAFHKSIRKSQRESPKFYFFDNGVKKALEQSLDSGLTPGTSAYGEAFESFVIQEIFRMHAYYQKEFRLSFFYTKNGTEIDLILSNSKISHLIEIKSTKRVNELEVRKLQRASEAFPGKIEKYYLSQDPLERDIEGVHCFHWQSFLGKMKLL